MNESKPSTQNSQPIKIRKKKLYLKPNRLADVLALIQVLAFDEKAKRSVDGLESELQGKPKSAESWKDIVIEHPEFFRFNKKEYDTGGGDKANAICLIVRHVSNAPVSPDLAKKFFETAIQLHDKEKERSDWWKVWLPFIAVMITVLGTIYVSSNKQSTNEIKISTKDSVLIIPKIRSNSR